MRFNRYAAIWLVATNFLSGNSGVAAPAYTDDRWNPAHLNSLSAPLKARLLQIAPICGSPVEAEHYIGTYIQANGAEYAILHFEHFRCGNRSVLCHDGRCLHEVYRTAGHTTARILQLYVTELRLDRVGGRVVAEMECGLQICGSIPLP